MISTVVFNIIVLSIVVLLRQVAQTVSRNDLSLIDIRRHVFQTPSLIRVCLLPPVLIISVLLFPH